MAIQDCFKQIKKDLSAKGISDDARRAIENGTNRRVSDALKEDISTHFDWTSASVSSSDNYFAEGKYKLDTVFGEVTFKFWRSFSRGSPPDEDGFGMTDDEYSSGAVVSTSSGKEFEVGFGRHSAWEVAMSAYKSIEQAILQKLNTNGISFEEFYDQKTKVLHIPNQICRLAKEAQIEKLKSEPIAGEIEVIELPGYTILSEELVTSLILGLSNLKKIVVPKYNSSLEQTFELIKKLTGVEIETRNYWW